MSTPSWWEKTSTPSLAQGELLKNCLVPVFPYIENTGDVEADIKQMDLIVVTQSCDLENEKVDFVALCPIHSLSTFEHTNPGVSWENVRCGRVSSLHLLASPDYPQDNQKALVVELGRIVSLPYYSVKAHAREVADRWRLLSPYLEHFSQAFGRVFMRVGLPSQIPTYKKKGKQAS